MKPQKTVILTDSKAALQSQISNTSNQPTHQLLKDLQLLPQECTVVLQWIPAHCGIPENKRADRLAKSGSKQLQVLSTSTYQEAKTLLWNSQRWQWRRANGDCNPLQTQSTVWQDMSRQLYSRCEQDTSLWAHLKRTGIMDSAACDFKEAEKTVHHTLQGCSIWWQKRHQLWPHDESATNKLWGRTDDLRRTTQLLATCRLRV